MVARKATKKRGVNNQANHHRSPPEATELKRRVSLGKRVTKTKKNIPRLFQKFSFPRGMLRSRLSRVESPTSAKKKIAIFKNVFMDWIYPSQGNLSFFLKEFPKSQENDGYSYKM